MRAKSSYVAVFLSLGGCAVDAMETTEEVATESNVLRCKGEDDGGARGTKICHATGSTTNPFVLITVSNRVLPVHRHHGDIIPAPPEGCPGDTPPPPVCAPGSVASCYDGPDGTEGVGACTSGTMTCNAEGSGYGDCAGSKAPVAEACGDGIDNDCDGNVDNGCVSGLAWFDMAPFVPGVPTNQQPGRNGLQDALELGIINVPIRLRTGAGTLIASTLTDANGIYSFGDVMPGVYYLEVTPQFPPSPPGIATTAITR